MSKHERVVTGLISVLETALLAAYPWLSTDPKDGMARDVPEDPNFFDDVNEEATPWRICEELSEDYPGGGAENGCTNVRVTLHLTYAIKRSSHFEGKLQPHLTALLAVVQKAAWAYKGTGQHDRAQVSIAGSCVTATTLERAVFTMPLALDFVVKDADP